MKVLRINDIIHKQLKKEAKDEGRTLQWIAEKKLTSPVVGEVRIQSGEKTAYTVIPDISHDKYDPTPVREEPKESPEYEKFMEVVAALDEHKNPTSFPAIALEKPCCKLSKPCIHWVFDGAEEMWTNSLSGRKREV